MIVRQMPEQCRLRKDRDSNPRSNVTRSPHFECGPFDHSGIFPQKRCKCSNLFDRTFVCRKIFFCKEEHGLH